MNSGQKVNVNALFSLINLEREGEEREELQLRTGTCFTDDSEGNYKWMKRTLGMCCDRKTNHRQDVTVTLSRIRSPASRGVFYSLLPG